MTTIKDFKKLALAAAAASALVGPTARADGVEFHGYMRTGVGTTSKGGGLQCFETQNIWPIRSKYRLGNECDSYGEAEVVAPFGKADGAWAKYHLMLALREKNATDFEATDANVNTNVDFVNKTSSTSVSQSFQIASRQNYIIGGGVFGENNAFQDAKVWVGKRFYNRHDINIVDYFYWANTGPGAGIEDVAIGKVAKFALAYHAKNTSGGTGSGHPLSDQIAKRLSTRFYDIGVNPGGKLEGEFVYHFGSSADPTFTAGKGYQIFLEHTQEKVLGGFNKVALIYGSKLGSGFEWLPTHPGASKGAEGDSSWRVHDYLYFDLGGMNITGMATASYGTITNVGGSKVKWTSVGARPQYNFNDNFSIAVEGGYDQGTNGSNPKVKVAKLTVAPQLALSKGFWARPVFRAFATYAKWNAAVGSNIANGVFGTSTNGMTYGVQVENWW